MVWEDYREVSKACIAWMYFTIPLESQVLSKNSHWIRCFLEVSAIVHTMSYDRVSQEMPDGIGDYRVQGMWQQMQNVGVLRKLGLYV
jgi:hypothetical protein